MVCDAQLKARDARRDIGAELLQAVRELSADQAARKTTFEPLADGSVRRTVLRADGSVELQAVLVGQRKACSNWEVATPSCWPSWRFDRGPASSVVRSCAAWSRV